MDNKNKPLSEDLQAKLEKYWRNHTTTTIKFDDEGDDTPCEPYKKTEILCIDAMISIFGADVVKNFLACSAFAYLWQHSETGADNDIDKAKWYLDKYVELKELTSNVQ